MKKANRTLQLSVVLLWDNLTLSPFTCSFFASRSEKGRSLVFGATWAALGGLLVPLYHYVIFYQNNKTSRDEEEGFLVLGAIWMGSLWHHFCHKEQG